MKRSRSLSLASFSLLAMPAIAQQTDSQQRGLLPYLPKDTVLAVSIPDIGKSLTRFEQMPVAKMWREKEVQTFVADLRTMVESQWKRTIDELREQHKSGQMPLDPDQLLKLRVNSCTAAITKLNVVAGDFGPQPEIGVMLHLDFGDSAAVWYPLIDMGLAMAQHRGGSMVEKTESKVGEVRVATFAGKGAASQPMTLNFAWVPNGLLIGTLTEEVKATLENMQKQTPVLSATADYQLVAKHTEAAGADFQMFARPSACIEFAINTLTIAADFDESGMMSIIDMDGVRRAITAMGWDKFGGVGSSSSMIDGKSVTRSFAPSSGGTASAKNVDMAFLKWVPKDIVSFNATTFDATSWYDTLIKGFEAYSPDLAKVVQKELAAAETELGFSFRNDLLGSLGDHSVNWSVPMPSMMSAPEGGMLLKVNDEAKLLKGLKGLTNLTNGLISVESGEKRGLTVHQLQFDFDQIAQLHPELRPIASMGKVLSNFQPVFAFKSGYLVSALSIQDVKRAMARLDREDDAKNDVRSNKEFASIAGSVPAVVGSLAFVDWKAYFEAGYQMVSSMIGMLPLDEQIPIDTQMLPDAMTLTKHLFPALTYTTTSPEGVTTISTGPFGLETLVGGLVAAAAVGSAFLPSKGDF